MELEGFGSGVVFHSALIQNSNFFILVLLPHPVVAYKF